MATGIGADGRWAELAIEEYRRLHDAEAPIRTSRLFDLADERAAIEDLSGRLPGPGCFVLYGEGGRPFHVGACLDLRFRFARLRDVHSSLRLPSGGARPRFLQLMAMEDFHQASRLREYLVAHGPAALRHDDR